MTALGGSDVGDATPRFRFVSAGREPPAPWEYGAWAVLVGLGPAFIAWMFAALDEPLTFAAVTIACGWATGLAMVARYDLFGLRTPRELLVLGDGGIVMRLGSRERRVAARDFAEVVISRPFHKRFGTQITLKHADPGRSRTFWFADKMSEEQEQALRRALDPLLASDG